VRENAGVRVTLLEPPTGSTGGRPIRRLTVAAERDLPVIGTYLLTYAHADFWRVSLMLSGAAQQGWTVRLTVDPDSCLIPLDYGRERPLPLVLGVLRHRAAEVRLRVVGLQPVVRRTSAGDAP
jgi:hypothetical protein